MRLLVDDDIYRVDAVWLGPPQQTLPWRARYSAYGVGLAVFVILQGVERQVGIGLGFFVLAWSLLATVLLTRLILSVVDHDRPLRSVLAAFMHEVDAPRERTKPTMHTFHPPKG
jgi:hypothetical protein